MSINNVVAFEGWNSSNRAWNTSTWNGDVTFDLTSTAALGTLIGGVEGDAAVTLTGFGTTASLGSFFTTNTQSAMTTSINSATITGDANVTVTGISGTSAIGSATITGDANVTVTGLAGTSALGSFFTTNESFKMVAVVGSGVIDTTQSCQVFPTGVSATGEIGTGTGEIFPTWGQIIPIQTPSYSAITPSQAPSFSAVTPSQSPSWTDIAA